MFKSTNQSLIILLFISKVMGVLCCTTLTRLMFALLNKKQNEIIADLIQKLFVWKTAN